VIRLQKGHLHKLMNDIEFGPQHYRMEDAINVYNMVNALVRI